VLLEADMFKIGDFSKLGQVSVRTLRHYDELDLLKPAQIDRFTDYRFYSIEQLPRLNRILALKDLGLSLEQIRYLLAENVSAEQLHGMLMLKQAEIEQEVQETQLRLRRVRARLQQIEQEGQVSPYEVILKPGLAQTLVSLRQCVEHVSDMKDYRYAMFRRIYGWLEERHIAPNGPEVVIYHNTEYTEHDINMEIAVSIAPGAAPALAPSHDHGITIVSLPATPQLATVLHHGFLWEVGLAITALYSWIGTNGYTGSGPYREVHIFGSETDIDNAHKPIVLEMQIPIEKSSD
jgi:DNA-binding transcriptional MerR regulator